MSTSDQWSVTERPKTLDEVVGQSAAKAWGRGLVKSGTKPGCILVTGPSGIGKTTIARIIGSMLSGWTRGPDINPDMYELPANVERTIENVRETIQRSKYTPRGGKRRIIIVDEVQGLVGPAASALLKACEDPAPHCTWVLCTDQPWKLTKAMANRTQSVKLDLCTDEEVAALLKRVAAAKKANLGKKADAVIAYIAKASCGVPREALQIMQSVHLAVSGGGSASEAVKMAVSSNPAADGFASALDYLKSLLDGNERAAVAAVARCSSADGMIELINKMIAALIRRSAGAQPADGVGWAAVRAIRTSPDLPTLLLLQSRIVAALMARTTNYAVPAESLLYGLCRKV